MSQLSEAVKTSLEIQTQQQTLEDLPIKVREIEEELASMEAEYQEKKRAFEEVDKQVAQIKTEQELEAQNLQDKEARLNAIKSQKEYKAVTLEISTAKNKNREREAQLIQLEAQLSQLKEDLSPLETKRNELQENITQEKSSISSDLSQCEGQIKALQNKLKEQLLALPDDIRHRYQLIQEKVQPPAALVESGTCHECFMSLPPQLFIEIQKRPDEVHVCPNCHRLLYLEE